MAPPTSSDDPDDVQNLIARYRETLVSEATGVLRAHPNADPVALIVDADSPAGQEFLDRAREDLGALPKGFIGVMPRRHALNYLRPEHPALLDWVADSRPPEGGRVLPVIAMIGTEAELGSIDLDEPL